MPRPSPQPDLRKARRRLALRRFLLGRSHRATGDAHYALGCLLRREGQTEAAVRSLTAAERIHRARLGPAHAAVALDLIAIGHCQADWAERRRALQSYERAERILRGMLRRESDDNPNPTTPGPTLRESLAELLAAMATVHRELEQTGKSRTYYEQALRILLDRPGPHSSPACDVALKLAGIGVDPLAVAREQGGESAASALQAAFYALHGHPPTPEPIA